MENVKKDKISRISKNPIIVFGILAIVSTLVLKLDTNMQVPTFYANKGLANEIAQKVPVNEIYHSTKHLITPHYYFWNGFFHFWTLMIILCIFCFIFKINSFEKLKKINILNSKLFAYPWVNISYLIFGYCYPKATMIDLEQNVYNNYGDSMGIPFLFLHVCVIMLAIIYYPLSNFMIFITYNTKIKRVFYNFLWILSLPVILLTALVCFDMHFSYYCIGLDACILIWLIFSIYAIGYKKN